MIDTGVSYFGNRMLRHFSHDLDDMISHGCTYIVHTLSENDVAFYRGTMGKLFRATRDAGMGVWADPWGVMGLFGGEAFSRFVSKRPQATQVLSDGHQAPAACPNHPLAREAMRSWIDAAIDAGADTVFWDEPHFYLVEWDETYEGEPQTWSCRCVTCQSLYRDQFAEAMPSERTQEVHAFRKDSLTRFLADMSGYAASKGARNAVCVLPSTEEEMEGLNWHHVAALPSMNVFGTDPYWFIRHREVEEYVGEQARKVVEVCRQYDKRAQIWLQAFKVPSNREQEISTAIHLAAKMGADLLAAWGYAGCEVMSSIASDRPQVVWEIIGDAFRQIRRE